MKCSVESCKGTAVCKDLCRSHYDRFRRYGDTTIVRGKNGNGSLKPNGYVVVEGKLQHIAIAEKALGHKLPLGAQVHHINGKRNDNRGENLVICPDQKYHRLLHMRQKALEGCGNASFRRCQFCRHWDDPSCLYISPNNKFIYHRACYRQREALR